LLVTSLLASERGRTAAVLTAVAFSMGWLGIATGRYKGTHRYTEPWSQVALQVVELSKPGDVILSSHPSLFFHVSYLLPWPQERWLPRAPLSAAGRTFATALHWRTVTAPPPERLIYVRTTLLPPFLDYDQQFLAAAPLRFRLARELRLEQDTAAGLKRHFFPNVHQPEWRIQIQFWERRKDS
jgi:hypothetical protein